MAALHFPMYIGMARLAPSRPDSEEDRHAASACKPTAFTLYSDR